MEDEGPLLARVLGTRRGRRLALAIEAELVALVAAAAAAGPDAPGDGTTGPEGEKVPRRGKVCVVFAGLGGYGRLLVHKTAERFEGLESFSIGGADNRRTVVLAALSQPTAVAYIPPPQTLHATHSAVLCVVSCVSCRVVQSLFALRRLCSEGAATDTTTGASRRGDPQ
jgi:hypothetical protein